MTVVDLPPFLLVDPPDGAEQQARQALAAISFDWSKVRPALSDDNGRVEIQWGPTDPGVIATYVDYPRSITFSAAYWTPGDPRFGRILIHEIGHMIDFAVLDNAMRRRLINLMLVEPDHDTTSSHPDVWRATHATGYWHRIHEAWADIFLATYAPSVYDGTVYTHRITDTSAVKAIIDRSIPMEVSSLGGANRFETAQLVSMDRWPYTHPVEVVIAAEGTPDVAPATVYAATSDPARTLLFVRMGDDTVPEETIEEIDRLRFGTSVYAVTYVGGTSAITTAARGVIETAAAGV